MDGQKPTAPSVDDVIEATEFGSAAIQVARLMQDEDKREMIDVSSDLNELADQAVTALVDLGEDSQLYRQAGGRLVHIVRGDGRSKRPKFMSADATFISEADLSIVRQELSRAARFSAGKEGEVAPPKDLALLVIGRKAWPGMRKLGGIIEMPTIRPDGSILDLPGYDEDMGLFYEPGCSYPSIKDKPTHEDARRALAALQEPWVDFPTTIEAAKALPLAAVLTVICRAAIQGSIPAFVFEASGPGSGKSLVVNCISIITENKEATFTAFPEGDNAELEKRLAVAGRSGRNTIMFDNVNGKFAGASLDMVLTATGDVSFRILGKSEEALIPWRATIIATGNNAQIVGDTQRRVLIQRLEPAVENPADRDNTKFRHPKLKEWCRENRTRLVGEALTLVRAYFEAGCPKQGIKSLGSFQEWADIIANAIVWAGGPNVLECLALQAAEEDPGIAAMRVLMSEWKRLAPNGTTAKDIVNMAFHPDYMKEKGDIPPDGLDNLRSAIEELAPPERSGWKPDPAKLGYVLRSMKGRILGGLKLVKDDKPSRTGVVMWLAKEAGSK